MSEGREIEWGGKTAYYEPHELELMREFTKRMEGLPPGEERTALLQEVTAYHEAKALTGGRFLSDAEEEYFGVGEPGTPQAAQPKPPTEMYVPPPDSPFQIPEGVRAKLAAAPPAEPEPDEQPDEQPELEPLPHTSSDHGLEARTSDPLESHLSGAKMEAREGTTATFTPGKHKHLILRAYAAAGKPLTDTQAWRDGAGLDPRSGAWHRCSDMLDAGAIEQVDEVRDPETNNIVRRCQPTAYGLEVLAQLDAGKRVKGAT